MKFRAFSLITALIVSFLFSAPMQVFAQYELKELTPGVQSALEARKNRFEKLTALKQQGVIGENNRGYVTLLKEDGPAGEIVDAENQDRMTIYTAIAEQNGLLSEMRSIEKVFAQVQRDKASSGEMVQSESGEWSTK